MIKETIAALLLNLAITGRISATEVSGDVWGSWAPAGNPYLVVGDLRVPSESSLVILPGCRIEFQGHYKLVVDSLALLQAIGTVSDSIAFTNSDTLEGWHGIRLYWADSACALAYCRLEWGRAADLHWPDTLISYGGAVHCVGTALSVQNCRLQFNRAWEGYGGAIYAIFSRITVRNSVLKHNLAGKGGGAVYAAYSTISIEGCDVSRDSTFYSLGGEHGGGAIGCFYSEAIIRDNLVANNLCGQIGGGIFLANSPSLVERNIIRQNEAFYFGGGLVGGGARIILKNNIISENWVWATLSSGGGIACGPGISLINNTIAGNYSTWYGGGIRYWTNTAPDTFINNIIWGNVAWQDSQIDLWENCPSPIMLYNDIQSGWPGVGNIDIDPLFRDTTNGDFHLMSTLCGDPFDSPAIDAGDPAILDSLLDCARGLGAARSDMGAFGGGQSNPDAVEDDYPTMPDDLCLAPAYPNPFNAGTTISFSLPARGEAKLEIFDILGHKVATLHRGMLDAGQYRTTWDAAGLPSGVYLARLASGGQVRTRSMALIK